jgi:predicted nucleic acid-binding Zn ribbon protein
MDNRKKLKKASLFMEEILKKYGIFDKIKENDIYVVWEDEVGKEIAKHAKPAFFKEGVLFVNVDNSAWFTELKFLKDKIIKKLNKRLGIDKIKDINLKIG